MRYRLRVTYLHNGNVVDDTRKGRNFRWKVDRRGVIHVFEHDRRGRVVWTATYAHPVKVAVVEKKKRGSGRC